MSVVYPLAPTMYTPAIFNYFQPSYNPYNLFNPNFKHAIKLDAAYLSTDKTALLAALNAGKDKVLDTLKRVYNEVFDAICQSKGDPALLIDLQRITKDLCADVTPGLTPTASISPAPGASGCTNQLFSVDNLRDIIKKVRDTNLLRAVVCSQRAKVTLTMEGGVVEGLAELMAARQLERSPCNRSNGIVACDCPRCKNKYVAGRNRFYDLMNVAVNTPVESEMRRALIDAFEYAPTVLFTEDQYTFILSALDEYMALKA